MGKKLEANGLWESSRMILPEHKEATRRQAKQVEQLVRPTLDDQEVEIISMILFQSHRHQRMVRLTLYDDPQSVNGIVTCTQRESFRLDTIDPYSGVVDWKWYPFSDVIKAELYKDWTLSEMQDF